MKTAIYIEDGRTQFVLTPESEIDKKVLDELQSTNLKTYRGEFYGCMGGWTRHSSPLGGIYETHSERSLIFVIDKAAPGVSLRPQDIIKQQDVNAQLDGITSGDTQCTYQEFGVYGIGNSRCNNHNGHEGPHYTEPTLENPMGRRMSGQ